jgi:hypothetical protein
VESRYTLWSAVPARAPNGGPCQWTIDFAFTGITPGSTKSFLPFSPNEELIGSKLIVKLQVVSAKN